MIKRDYEEYRRAFEGVPKPFAYLDLDLLSENIRSIAGKCGNKTLRLASKSLRSVRVIQFVLQASDRFRGVMCFTVPEAVYLAEQGLDDLLVGYPAWEPEHLRQAARKIAGGRRITLMADSAEHIDHLEAIARETGVRIPVCLDIDMSVSYPGLHFGVRRSPLRTAEEALALVRRIASSPHLLLDGLMGYEAQIAGVGDRYPGAWAKNLLVRVLKRHSVRVVAERRAELVQAVRELGIPLRFVNGGGTGSLATTARDPSVTEVTVGSGIYAPALFDYYRDFRYQPAAGFAIEIVRRPHPGIYTCAGGGYVASGAAGRDKLPVPYLPEGARPLPLEGAGEVQTPIRYEGPISLEMGDPIFMRHAKAGELCERFDRLHLLSEGRIIGEATTYRGDGRCFL
jgi:D-serine deaminase-like pyridoxal phosphate-dependent protein